MLTSRSTILAMFALLLAVPEGLHAQDPGSVTVRIGIVDSYTSDILEGIPVTAYRDGVQVDSKETDAHGFVEFTFALTGLGSAPDLPRRFSLSENYPNPFQASTSLDLEVADMQTITVGIYNILGQRVLVQDYPLSPGSYTLSLSLGNLPVGVYFLRTFGGGTQQVVKMTKTGSSNTPVQVHLADRGSGIPGVSRSERVMWAGFAFKAGHDRYQERFIAFDTLADTTITMPVDRLNEVELLVIDDEGRIRERDLLISGPFVNIEARSPGTIILKSGVYSVSADGDFSTPLDDHFEVISVDTSIALPVETISHVAYKAPPNNNGLLYYEHHISGQGAYYYGVITDGLLNLTHLVLHKPGEDPAVVFFDEYFVPIHWMFGDQTIAAMRTGEGSDAISSEEKVHIMTCSGGENSLTFGLDKDELVQDVLDRIISEMDPDAAKAMKQLRDVISDIADGKIRYRDLAEMARQPSVHQWLKVKVTTAFSISHVSKELTKRFNVPGTPIAGVITQILEYMDRISGDFYDGNDITGPRVEMLLCRGASLIPQKCNRFFLFNKPGNVTKCVERCIVTLNCFTDICHPMPLSVGAVLNYQQNH